MNYPRPPSPPTAGDYTSCTTPPPHLPSVSWESRLLYPAELSSIRNINSCKLNTNNFVLAIKNKNNLSVFVVITLVDSLKP